MGNGDAVKAAKNRRESARDKGRQIAAAARKAHQADKLEQERLTQIRRFEDAGLGYHKVTATGRQYEHEERMREEKAKRAAKAAKSKVFFAVVQQHVVLSETDGDEGADESTSSDAQPTSPQCSSPPGSPLPASALALAPSAEQLLQMRALSALCRPRRLKDIEPPLEGQA